MKKVKAQFPFLPVHSKRQLSHSTEKGMTLIEILAVVAILLVLMIAAFRALGGDIAKSRDAQRKKDLRAIKTAMEDYYDDHQAYPPKTFFEKSACGTDIFAPYLKVMPCDPVTGEPYLYLSLPADSDAPTQGYRVLTRLDISSDPIIGELGCVNGCVPDYPNYVYGISEGVALSSNESTVPGFSVTPMDANYCATHECYCCPSAGAQNCMQWNGSGQCYEGPWKTPAECMAHSRYCGSS